MTLSTVGCIAHAECFGPVVACATEFAGLHISHGHFGRSCLCQVLSSGKFLCGIPHISSLCGMVSAFKSNCAHRASLNSRTFPAGTAIALPTKATAAIITISAERNLITLHPLSYRYYYSNCYAIQLQMLILPIKHFFYN